VPERKVARGARTRWTELFQQPAQLAFDFRELESRLFAAREVPERHEDQQRLVRRTAVVTLPHADVVEGFEDFVGRHDRSGSVSATAYIVASWRWRNGESAMGQGSRVKGQGSRVKGQGARSKEQGARGKEQGARGEEAGRA
jgi:hypothetical protein